jgi:ketosteroid isomerase-like protein
LSIQERFDCWNRAEFEPMEEMYAEDVVFDVSAVFTDVTPLRGKEDTRRYWYELRETWAGLRIDPVEVLDVGDGRYLADLRLWGKGKRSGAEVEQRFGMLYTVRPEEGKVIRAQLFPNVAAALSAAESSAAQTA